MYKVSIIVPVYNVEKYLPDCLDSIINQTYKELEIILINDGSTDTSGQICDEYSWNDERIKVIHQKNSGAANAKNVGLDKAIGDYITFADSDDIVDKNWIETMMNLIIENNADMAECYLDKIYVNGFEKIEESVEKYGVFTNTEYLEQYLKRWTSSLFCLKLFKAELTKNIRFRKERRCIDDEFYTYKVVSNAKKIVITDKILYHYRQRRSSAVSSTKNQLQITDDAIELRIERYEWIKRNFCNLRKAYILDDINFLIYFAQNSVNDKNTVLKFKKTSRYYFKEAIKLGFDLKLIYISIKFLFCKPNMNYIVEKTNNIDNYFE